MDDIFVGRHDELAQLRMAFGDVEACHPRLVLIVSPAGMGKTALVDRFIGTLDPLRVLRASGDENETALHYGVVEQLVGLLATSTAALADADRAEPHPEPFQVGARLLEAVGQLEDDAPVVIVVEDTHWADPLSLQAVTFFLRRLRFDRVLTVLTARDEAVGALPAGLHRLLDGEMGTTLELEGLGATEVAQLAGALGAGPLPAWAGQKLRDHTRGSPLHLRALCHELSADQLRAEGDLPAPRSFASLILRRLASCAPETEQLVVACAVLGMRCPLALADRLAGVDAVLVRLREAVLAGLLSPDGPPVRNVAFVHPLVRAAIYHDLGVDRRAVLHTRAAELVGDEAASLRHRVAAAAGEDEELAAKVADLGRRQAGRGAWDAAGLALRSAAGLAPAGPTREGLLLEAVECRVLAGELDDARSLADDVARLAPTPRRDYVLGRLAQVYGDNAEAECMLSAAWNAFDLQRPPEPEVAARAAVQLSVLHMNEGRAHEAVRWARRALDVGPPATTNAVDLLVINLAVVGRADEALALVASLPDHPGETEPHQLDGLLGRGMVRMWTDDLAGGRSDLAALVATCRRRGPFHSGLIALHHLADAEYRLGLWNQARVHAELAVSQGDDAAQFWHQALNHAVAAFPLAGRGDWKPAELHAQAAREAADHLGDAASITWAAMARARVGQARGDQSSVVTALGPLGALVVDHPGVDEPRIQPWRELWAEALVGLGRLDEAEAVLAPAEALAARRSRRSALAGTARVRAVLESARGRRAGAEEAFTHACAHAEGLDQPFEQALLDDAYGRFLRRSGRRRLAAARLGAARDAFHRLGARPFLERCDRELAACGLAPRSRADHYSLSLTSQELAVAQLVASGLTNREAAAELVLSVKTVEYHLGHVFAKLGVARRSQLHAVLAVSSPSRPTAIDD